MSLTRLVARVRTSSTMSVLVLGLNVINPCIAQVGGVMPPGWCQVQDVVCEPGPCNVREGLRPLIVLPGPGQFVGLLMKYQHFNWSDDGKRYAERQTEGLVSSGYAFVIELNILPQGSEISSLETTSLQDGPERVSAIRLSGKKGVILNPRFPQQTWGMVELELYVEKFGPLQFELTLKRPGLPVQKVRFIGDPIRLPLPAKVD